MSNSTVADRAARVAFYASIFLGVFALGYLVHRHAWWPHPIISDAEQAYRELKARWRGDREWYYFDTTATERVTQHRPESAAPGATLVAYVGADNHQFIQVLAADGEILNQWRVDWFDLWPDASHLADDIRPKTLPGAIVHGVWLMDDGGVLLQHDACGMIRLDACGHVQWRLPERTHHSLHVDERGHIWTSNRLTRKEPNPNYPSYHPPFEEYTICEISPDGKVLQDVSLFDLLRENEMMSLLYMSTWHDNTVETGGDTLHVNDVEVFPSTLKPGLFQPGDVMVSLRRTNAVVVFDLAQRRVRHVSVGGFVRQHDPDFIDGDTISVFDNNHIGHRHQGVQSRIVLKNAAKNEVRIAYVGTAEQPFFTDIMGKHQWLPNGNLLVVESTRGRVLELDSQGRLVWVFVNVLGNGLAGAVSEGIRLPETVTATFFGERKAACQQPGTDAPGRVPAEKI